MSVEAATYIHQLDATNPDGSSLKSEGDNHLRLVKSTLKATFPNVAGAVSATDTELSYAAGVTSAIQNQLNAKGAIAGQTWTGTHVFPADTTIGNVSPTEIGYLDGVTSAIQTQINTKGAIGGQTWTGTHVFPSTTTIGTTTGTEISYLSGVTSSVQGQINSKAPLASPTFTGTPRAPTQSATDNSTLLATTAQVQAALTAYAGTNLGLPTFTGADALKSLRLNASGTGYEWTNSLSGLSGTFGGATNHTATVTIASASTTDIGAAGSNSVIVSGTTTINALGTIAAGAERIVTFSGALTLTHNATSLILPSGASITTAAGDVARFLSLGSGNWRCISYSRATGEALVLGASSGHPSLTPSFLADFANSRAIDPRITITRPSTAFRVNQFGLYELLASGVGRVDFSPVALNCRGLLIEESRANLLTYSDQFDNAAWTKNNATISANAAIAPDGSMTADKLVEAATSGIHILSQSATGAPNTVYTLSAYFKAAERSIVQVQLDDTGSNGLPFSVNVATGTITTPAANSGTASGANGIVSAVGNGWYRVAISGIPFTSGTSIRGLFYIKDSSNSVTYTGDGTSGLYIWRAKLEPGAFPTSPDQTVASTVTRAADSATVTGTSFSSWYRQDEGSVIVTARSAPGVGSVDQHVFSLTDSGGTNRITLYRNTSRFAVLVIDVGGVTQATLTSATTWADDTEARIGVAFKANDFALTLNGAAVVTASSGSMPTVDRLVIGNTVAGNRSFNGWIARLPFYPKRITNAELIALANP